MRSSQVPHFLTIILTFLSIHHTLAIDNTLVEKSVGVDVVEAVIEKIRHGAIFTEDYEFLRRVAYVESRDGESNKTFLPEGYFGGIWQVSERFFDTSKGPSLASFHDKIKTSFNIDWASVSWRDLLKPLYSGLAARLYVQSTGAEIPQTKKEQALYWDQYYNHKDEYDPSTFEDAVEELEEETVICSGKMDLVTVLDGSSSVNENDPGNFKRCLSFVSALIGTYSLETVRHGFIVYATFVENIFDLNNMLTLKDLQKAVTTTLYPNTRTDTNAAIQAASDMFTASTPRQGVPQVFLILTDGESTSPGVDKIQLLKDAGVSSYVVGITDFVNLSELDQLAYNIPSNVFTLNNFEVLTELFKRLNTETCKVPQKPEMDIPVDDRLKKSEKRFYAYTIPTEGMTILVNNVEGQTKGFYSFDQQNPSSAIFDGELAYEGTFIQIPPGRASNTVYIAMQGLESKNNYQLEPKTGFFVEPTTTPRVDDRTSTEEATSEEPTTTTSTTSTEGFANRGSACFLIVIASLLSVGIVNAFGRI